MWSRSRHHTRQWSCIRSTRRSCELGMHGRSWGQTPTNRQGAASAPVEEGDVVRVVGPVALRRICSPWGTCDTSQNGDQCDGGCRWLRLLMLQLQPAPHCACCWACGPSLHGVHPVPFFDRILLPLLLLLLLLLPLPLPILLPLPLPLRELRRIPGSSWERWECVQLTEAMAGADAVPCARSHAWFVVGIE